MCFRWAHPVHGLWICVLPSVVGERWSGSREDLARVCVGEAVPWWWGPHSRPSPSRRAASIRENPGLDACATARLGGFLVFLSRNKYH